MVQATFVHLCCIACCMLSSFLFPIQQFRLEVGTQALDILIDVIRNDR